MGRWLLVCFFFQAEDGIRDLVRSRGLGDVYKRQGPDDAAEDVGKDGGGLRFGADAVLPGDGQRVFRPVSYTHLTLPTSDLV